MPETTNSVSQKNSNLIISYLTIRKSIGVMGFVLPVILPVGTFILNDCEQIQGSISAYYYTAMRNVFVGILSAVAFFLFSYKGYDQKDRVISILSGLCCLGIALLPTSVDGPLTQCVSSLVDNGIVGHLHLILAAAFFLLLSYFSIFLFTKGAPNPTTQKIRRNKVFRCCGYTMIFSIACIGLYFAYFKDKFPQLIQYDVIFWLETIALWAFGTSWLIKGEFLLGDE